MSSILSPCRKPLNASEGKPNPLIFGRRLYLLSPQTVADSVEANSGLLATTLHVNEPRRQQSFLKSLGMNLPGEGLPALTRSDVEELRKTATPAVLSSFHTTEEAECTLGYSFRNPKLFHLVFVSSLASCRFGSNDSLRFPA